MPLSTYEEEPPDDPRAAAEDQAASSLAQLGDAARALAWQLAQPEDIDRIPVGQALDLWVAKWLGWTNLVTFGELGVVGIPPAWYRGPCNSETGLANVPPFSTSPEVYSLHLLTPLTAWIVHMHCITQVLYQKPPGWDGGSIADHLQAESRVFLTLEGWPSYTEASGVTVAEAGCRAFISGEPVLPRQSRTRPQRD